MQLQEARIVYEWVTKKMEMSRHNANQETYQRMIKLHNSISNFMDTLVEDYIKLHNIEDHGNTEN
jgi:hypothetical protein